MNYSNDFAKNWDCIIIGAGPSGALAARQIALHNKQVLLIDKADFPRSKVCGCCINGFAQAALIQAGLAKILSDNHAVTLRELSLYDRALKASLPLPKMVSLSRERFDMSLINAAIECGVQFLPKTSAQVLSLNEVPSIQIQSATSNDIIQGKVIIVADGLAGRSLDLHNNFDSTLQFGSRFGAGSIVEDDSDFYQAGQIYMACGKGGYVGLVRLEDHRLDIAAAFDREFSRNASGPAAAAACILKSCLLPVPALLAKSHWTGTDLLSRKRENVAGNRLFIIGDACGYPEPFTGEGIAWALWSGLMVADLATSGIDCWNNDLIRQWNRIHKVLSKQKIRSKIIATTLRHEKLRYAMIKLLSVIPSAASPFVNLISSGSQPLRQR